MSRPAPQIRLSAEEKETWNGRLLAQRLGDVSQNQVWRVTRKHNLHLERRQSWCVSTDPEFSREAADVVGLYLNRPQNGLHHNTLCRSGGSYRADPLRTLSSPPQARVSGFHE